ncbi:hypothetical protein [Roseibium sp.]|uniref:hypothetical protein n=1 Tax=Roseibium sp. TaxID=1936156 RepID=UPI003D0F4BE6
MRKILSLAFLCLLTAGCVSSTQPLSSGDRGGLTGKTIAMTTRGSPAFLAMTAGKGMFAVAGVAVAAASGNELVRNNNIADPTEAIAQGVAAAYGAAYDMQVVEPVNTVSTSDISAIVKASGGANYVLDVASLGWGYTYLGFNFNQFRVGYTVNMRVIDASTGKVISTDSCIYDPKKMGKPAVSHDELLADGAAYIKKELADATRLCVQKFSPK